MTSLIDAEKDARSVLNKWSAGAAAVGWAIKAGVASAVTKAMGETMISYFKKRSPFAQ